MVEKRIGKHNENRGGGLRAVCASWSQFNRLDEGGHV